jgi:hypothetical protein
MIGLGMEWGDRRFRGPDADFAEEDSEDPAVPFTATCVVEPGLELAKNGHAGAEPVPRQAGLKDPFPDG